MRDLKTTLTKLIHLGCAYVIGHRSYDLNPIRQHTICVVFVVVFFIVIAFIKVDFIIVFFAIVNVVIIINIISVRTEVYNPQCSEYSRPDKLLNPPPPPPIFIILCSLVKRQKIRFNAIHLCTKLFSLFLLYIHNVFK